MEKQDTIYKLIKYNSDYPNEVEITMSSRASMPPKLMLIKIHETLDYLIHYGALNAEVKETDEGDLEISFISNAKLVTMTYRLIMETTYGQVHYDPMI